MEVSISEIMMLLGEKDIVIFQQAKKIEELQRELRELKIPELPLNSAIQPKLEFRES